MHDDLSLIFKVRDIHLVSRMTDIDLSSTRIKTLRNLRLPGKTWRRAGGGEFVVNSQTFI